MQLAKPQLDIGLFTSNISDHLKFWRDFVGLHLDHELFMEEGWIQYRHNVNNSVIKVNHYCSPLNHRSSSGYSCLSIARHGINCTKEGFHPGGELVRIVPVGTNGIVGIGITITTPDPDRMMKFYLEAMGFERTDDYIARCGDSLLFVEKGVCGYESNSFIGANFRYLTVQVFDADKAIREIVARGGLPGSPAIDFRDVARYGFVRDPDGNWIEISARRSLINAYEKY